MSDNWSIKVEGVSKKFGLSFREVMKYGLRDSLRRLVGVSDHTGILREGEFWAVRDVSFELEPGASLGIMGINGSGKSTLLRILHGIYNPDAGRVALKGRVGALIAAGAGFAPMLTGRENIHVNGAMLGMTPGEIKDRMDDIINFAELNEFIDMPVKHYSSGMFVRLGFAVAAMSQPEILLIDEVLAVGDMNFQKKCYEYLHRLKREGTTIVLVSHAIGAIWALCDRAIFLHEGELKVKGTAEDVIRAYEEQNFNSALRSQQKLSNRTSDKGEEESDVENLPAEYGYMKSGTGDVLGRSLRIFSPDNEIPTTEVPFKSPFAIEVELDVKNYLEDPLFRFVIDAVHYKYITTVDSYEQGFPLEPMHPGKYRLRVVIKDQNFRPGLYTVNVAVCRKAIAIHLLNWLNAGQLIIKHPTEQFLYSDPHAIMHLNADFSVNNLD